METIEEKTIGETAADRIYDRLNMSGLGVKDKLRSMMKEILEEEINIYRKAIRKSIHGTESKIGISNVIELVCDYYRVTYDEVQSNTRLRRIAEPRQLIHWMIRNRVCSNSLSTEAIGKMVGNRNHATVIYSIKAIDFLINTDSVFRERVMIICNDLGVGCRWIAPLKKAGNGKLLITGSMLKTK